MLPSQALVLICVSTIFPVLSVIAVGLRIYARRLTSIKLNASDYIVLFTLLNAILNSVTCIIGAIDCGIGRPLSELSDYIEVRFLKILFVTQFFHVFSVFSVKVSVVLFYRSIFTTPAFRRAANIMLTILGAWIIAFFFVTLFQDKPIKRNWGTVGTTINWPIFYIVEIASDVLLDVCILCMPLPVISRLRINRKKKWLLGGVFWLGAFVVVASTVRLYYMVLVKQQFQREDDDFSFTTVNTIIWGAIEPCTSVVAACLPIIGPVILRKSPSKKARPTVISSFFRKKSMAPSEQTARPFRGLSTDSGEPFGSSTIMSDGFSTYSANIGKGGSCKVRDDGTQHAMPNGIQVTSDFTVKEIP